MLEEETTVRITNPDRILRLMRHMCSAKLSVFIRVKSDQSVAVKGTAFGLKLMSHVPSVYTAEGFFVTHISARGIAHLKNNTMVQVEFVTISAKIMFSVKVLKCSKGSLLVEMPKVLISLERRKNSRCKIVEHFPSFFQLRSSIENDVGLVPSLPHHAQFAHRLHVVDISVGGLCLHSHFPGFHRLLIKGMELENSTLIMPMQEHIDISMKVMWIKKIREQVIFSASLSHVVVSYRFGCEFIDDNEARTHQIKRYMQQLTQAEGI